jgi:hypothetical protein
LRNPLLRVVSGINLTNKKVLPQKMCALAQV